MTRKRWVWVLVLVGIINLIPPVWAGAQPSRLASLWQQYVPSETTGLLGIDMARLKQSPWYRYVGPKGHGAPGSPQLVFDALAARTGFDLRQHVRTWWVAWWYQADGIVVAGTRVGYLAMGWGAVDVAKPTTVLTAHGAQVQEVNGQRVFVFDRVPTPQHHAARSASLAASIELPPLAITFPTPETILVGTPTQVMAAVMRRPRRASANPAPNDLLTQVQAVTEQPPIWMIDNNPTQFWLQLTTNARFGMSPIAPLLQGMERSTVQIDLVEPMRARMDVTCQSAMHTQALLGLSRALLALGRSSVVGQSMALPPFLQALTLNAEHTTLRFSTSLDQRDMGALFETWSKP